MIGKTYEVHPIKKDQETFNKITSSKREMRSITGNELASLY